MQKITRHEWTAAVQYKEQRALIHTRTHREKINCNGISLILQRNSIELKSGRFAWAAVCRKTVLYCEEKRFSIFHVRRNRFSIMVYWIRYTTTIRVVYYPTIRCSAGQTVMLLWYGDFMQCLPLYEVCLSECWMDLCGGGVGTRTRVGLTRTGVKMLFMDSSGPELGH